MTIDKISSRNTTVTKDLPPNRKISLQVKLLKKKRKLRILLPKWKKARIWPIIYKIWLTIWNLCRNQRLYMLVRLLTQSKRLKMMTMTPLILIQMQFHRFNLLTLMMDTTSWWIRSLSKIKESPTVYSKTKNLLPTKSQKKRKRKKLTTNSNHHQNQSLLDTFSSQRS